MVALKEAVQLHRDGKYKASLPHYIEAVQHDTRLAAQEGRSVNPDILHAAGIALAQGGKRKEAIQFLEGALENGRAGSGAVWSALALAYVEDRNLGRAERAYHNATHLDPSSCANWVGFGNLAYAGGALEIGDRRYDKALSCAARDAEELMAQGMIHLQRGHWRKGWRSYEARYQTSMWEEKNPHIMPFKGETQFTYWRQPVKDQTVLVLSEQGQGDAVQFARYIPWFIERFKVKVIFQVHNALYDMLNQSIDRSDVCVVNRDMLVPAHDGWCLLLSLPAILRENNCKLVPDPIRPFNLRWDKVGSGNRIFTHARGNPAHGYDFDRSGPPDLLTKAVESKGYTEVTAQYKNIASDEGPAVLEDPSWASTCEQLMWCDRVLTVDTGLAHVAGSMGIPTDLMVPTIPEWRWGRTTNTTTVWYPSVKLWRRERTDHWQEMLDRITATWPKPEQETHVPSV